MSASMLDATPMITGRAPTESQVKTMSRSKRLEPCGRCHTSTAVRVALPCGRLVSLCIPCASVFARFLSKRIRDLARAANFDGRPHGQVSSKSPVNLVKDSLHTFQGMTGGNIARKVKSQRLRADKRGETASSEGSHVSPQQQRQESWGAAADPHFANAAVERSVLPTHFAPGTPKSGGGGVGGTRQRALGGRIMSDSEARDSISPQHRQAPTTVGSSGARGTAGTRRKLAARSNGMMGMGHDGIDTEGCEGLSRKMSGGGIFPELVSPLSSGVPRACASPLNGVANGRASPLGLVAGKPQTSVKMRFGLPAERHDRLADKASPAFSGGGTSVTAVPMVARERRGVLEEGSTERHAPLHAR